VPMVQAEDSFRATMHVALPDVYGPSAQSPAQLEPAYQERGYFPASEMTVQGFAPNAQAFAPNSTTTVIGNGDNFAQPIPSTLPSSAVETNLVTPRKPAAPKVEKAMNGLPGTKPPRVGVNIEWVQKGVGWDCREVYYVGKKRHRRHLGHIGRQKWEDMQQQFQGVELERVLSEWIEERRAEKSLNAPQ
jgi:hypothetical protein